MKPPTCCSLHPHPTGNDCHGLDFRKASILMRLISVSTFPAAEASTLALCSCTNSMTPITTHKSERFPRRPARELKPVPGKRISFGSAKFARSKMLKAPAGNCKFSLSVTPIFEERNIHVGQARAARRCGRTFQTDPMRWQPGRKTQNASFKPSCMTRLLPEPTSGLPAATSGVEHPQPNPPGVLGSLPMPPPPPPTAAPYGLARIG